MALLGHRILILRLDHSDGPSYPICGRSSMRTLSSRERVGYLLRRLGKRSGVELATMRPCVEFAAVRPCVFTPTSAKRRTPPAPVTRAFATKSFRLFPLFTFTWAKLFQEFDSLRKISTTSPDARKTALPCVRDFQASALVPVLALLGSPWVGTNANGSVPISSRFSTHPR